ncbi:hypothetical protein M0802_016015 [Mischocyttarus mexicanus]|nr:hypothetical protein M0802_016015 [Mischocyttarus mexicanus]
MTQLKDNEKTYKNNREVKKRWSNILHKKVDGIALKESAKVLNQHTWDIHPKKSRDQIRNWRTVQTKDFGAACQKRHKTEAGNKEP